MQNIQDIGFLPTVKALNSRKSPPFYQAVGEAIQVKIGEQALEKPRFLVIRHQIMLPPYFHSWPLTWFNGLANYFRTQPQPTYYVIDYGSPCKNVGYEHAFAAHQLFPESGLVNPKEHYFTYVRDLNEKNVQDTLTDAKLTQEFYRLHIEIPFKLQSQVYFLAQRFPKKKALSTYDEELSSLDQLRLAASIIEAKNALHREGIIHNNINENNILVEKINKNKFSVRIVDFSQAEKINSQTEENLYRKDDIAIAEVFHKLLNENLAGVLLLLDKYHALHDKNLTILINTENENFFEELLLLHENKLITSENIDLVFRFLTKNYYWYFSWKERRQVFFNHLKENPDEFCERHFQFMLSSYQEYQETKNRDKNKLCGCASRIYENLRLLEMNIIPIAINLSDHESHYYYSIINLLEDDENFKEKLYLDLNKVANSCPRNLKVIDQALLIFASLCQKKKNNKRSGFLSYLPEAKDEVYKFFTIAQRNGNGFFDLLAILDGYKEINDQQIENLIKYYFRLRPSAWCSIADSFFCAVEVLNDRGLLNKENIDVIYKEIHAGFRRACTWFAQKIIDYDRVNILDAKKLQQIINRDLPTLEEIKVGFKATFCSSPEPKLSF